MICPVCKKTFTPIRKGHIYCVEKCHNIFRLEQKRKERKAARANGKARDHKADYLRKNEERNGGETVYLENLTRRIWI